MTHMTSTLKDPPVAQTWMKKRESVKIRFSVAHLVIGLIRSHQAQGTLHDFRFKNRDRNLSAPATGWKTRKLVLFSCSRIFTVQYYCFGPEVGKPVEKLNNFGFRSSLYNFFLSWLRGGGLGRSDLPSNSPPRNARKQIFFDYVNKSASLTILLLQVQSINALKSKDIYLTKLTIIPYLYKSIIGSLARRYT